MGPYGARYQEQLYWRGPAAIFWTGLEEKDKVKKYIFVMIAQSV
jgi:hypothetical protein